MSLFALSATRPFGERVALEVARALQAPLDLVLVRKLGVPDEQVVACLAEAPAEAAGRQEGEA